WVDICRNGRFLEPISNGFRTGLLGGDAPDYAVSVAIALDTKKAITEKTKRQIGKEGEEANLYPLKIRVTYSRQPRYFSLDKPYYLTKNEFDELSKSRKPDLINARREADKKFAEANRIVDEIRDFFSFDEFSRIYNSKTKSVKDVYSVYEEYIQNLKDNKQHGTVNSYTCALNHLRKYKPKLFFRDITPEFLKKYAKSSFKEESGTIGIYLRPLRAVYNYAIDVKKIARRDDFPFGKNKYVIPKYTPREMLLSMEDLKKIYEYHQSNIDNKVTKEILAIDLFIFSYFCQGMNFSDIMDLKYSNILIDNIGDKYIYFNRNKTKNTVRQSEYAYVYINPLIEKILDKHGNLSKDKDNYLFPFYESISGEERFYKIKEELGRMRKALKRVAKKLDINSISFYWSRHTWATHARQQGYGYDDIRDMMAQKTTTVTQGYVHRNEKFPVFKDASIKLLSNLTSKNG
ncbi:hypothetical protein D0T84_21635, partial [Dysgonomonas sp. 521]|uniref:site-specific integrase n=1 Tax=Dysgonomonas sp. 521 TaxID=2302932 RepID=UPI0013D7FF62